MTENQRSLAIDEWKLCQGLIGQQEQIIFRRQGWFFALITGLSVVVLKKESPFITNYQYLWISLGLTFLFYIVELIQRLPHSRAIKRSEDIEACLRGGNNYDGPILSESVGQGGGWKDMFQFCFRARTLAPYFAVLFAIFVVFCSSTVWAGGTAYEDTLSGKKCSENRQILSCQYTVGKDLEFSIDGIGQPDMGITFARSNYKGDYYATFGLMHGCIVVKHGRSSHLFGEDAAFVSPKNGKVYRTWEVCNTID